MEINESPCLHVSDFDFPYIEILIGLPPPHMSIFSLVKGGKEHKVFEMRMWEKGCPE